MCPRTPAQREALRTGRCSPLPHKEARGIAVCLDLSYFPVQLVEDRSAADPHGDAGLMSTGLPGSAARSEASSHCEQAAATPRRPNGELQRLDPIRPRDPDVCLRRRCFSSLFSRFGGRRCESDRSSVGGCDERHREQDHDRQHHLRLRFLNFDRIFNGLRSMHAETSPKKETPILVQWQALFLIGPIAP